MEESWRELGHGRRRHQPHARGFKRKSACSLLHQLAKIEGLLLSLSSCCRSAPEVPLLRRPELGASESNTSSLGSRVHAHPSLQHDGCHDRESEDAPDNSPGTGRRLWTATAAGNSSLQPQPPTC